MSRTVGKTLLLATLATLLAGCGMTQSVAQSTASTARAIFYKQVTTLHLDLSARTAINRDQAEMNSLRNTLLRYEPRLARVQVELLPQQLPGHLQYRLDLLLKGGRQLTFATALSAEGKVLVSHLKRQQWVSR